jgi:hypothetical protein
MQSRESGLAGAGPAERDLSMEICATCQFSRWAGFLVECRLIHQRLAPRKPACRYWRAKDDKRDWGKRLLFR